MTIMITDLPMAEELDRKTMAATRGGHDGSVVNITVGINNEINNAVIVGGPGGPGIGGPGIGGSFNGNGIGGNGTGGNGGNVIIDGPLFS
jgi:hypothetical protein